MRMRYLIVITILACLQTTIARAEKPLVVNGEELYRQHCAACHNRLENTDKPDRTVNRIASAIRQIPPMADLKSLSPGEIKSIAMALEQLTQ